MREILLSVLEDALAKLYHRVPKTKTKIETIDIQGFNPWTIQELLEDYKVPKECWFTTNGREAAEVAYEVEIPTTDEDKLTYMRKSFNGLVFPILYDAMKRRGYKRVGFHSHLLDEFKDTTVYDMYVSKDFDRLVKFYSLFFVHDKDIEIGENKRKWG